VEQFSYEPGNWMLWGVPVMTKKQELTTVGWVMYFIYQCLVILSFTSHIRTAFGDPGFITALEPPNWNRENGRRCDKCVKWKPPRAHHCKVCKTCVFRMDHHCPWVNNCVGLKNQKYFILFLFYTAAACLMTGLLMLYSLYCWFSSGTRVDDVDLYATVLCIGAFGASVFFLFFVIDFLTEQIDAIETNSTLVETYKRAHGQPGTFFTNFIEVMGPPSLWLFPVFAAPNICWTEPLYDDDKENDYFGGSQKARDYTPAKSKSRSGSESGKKSAGSRSRSRDYKQKVN